VDVLDDEGRAVESNRKISSFQAARVRESEARPKGTGLASWWTWMRASPLVTTSWEVPESMRKLPEEVAAGTEARMMALR
jgi:hypothetical protein